MNKPTKGPWKLEAFSRKKEQGIGVLDADSNVIAWLFTATPNAFGNMTGSTLPTQANAQLIRTAPEMLDLLKWALGQLEEGNKDTISAKNLFGARLRQLIEKAEGNNGKGTVQIELARL